MKHIEGIHVETFKGLKNVRFENCGDINIIVGDKNTCKTSVLEAVQLFNKPLNIEELMLLSRKRHAQYKSFLKTSTSFDSLKLT